MAKSKDHCSCCKKKTKATAVSNLLQGIRLLVALVKVIVETMI